jgi:hypothetical protein
MPACTRRVVLAIDPLDDTVVGRLSEVAIEHAEVMSDERLILAAMSYFPDIERLDLNQANRIRFVVQVE